MEDFTAGVICGLLVGLLVVGGTVALIVENSYYKKIEKLGQSICEEEYGMDFERYYDEVLRCKPFKERYDGIQVEVPKVSN